MRSRLPHHKGDGRPSCFYPPPLAAVKHPPGRAGVSRKHSVLMSKRACRGNPCPQCRLRAELFGKVAGMFSELRSGSATLPNPIFYLLLHFPCLGKKILHRSVLIIPQTLCGAVREPVRTQKRHNHPPKTGKVACSLAIGRQTITICCTA